MTFDLKAWRKVKNLSQSDIARKLGVSLKTVSNWELGAFSPPTDLQERLGGAVIDPANMSVEELDRFDPIVTPETHAYLFRVTLHGRFKSKHRTRLHAGYHHGGCVRASEQKRYEAHCRELGVYDAYLAEQHGLKAAAKLGVVQLLEQADATRDNAERARILEEVARIMRS